MMLYIQMTLLIQLRTRDQEQIKTSYLSQKEIFMLRQEVRGSLHNLTVVNISEGQAVQTKKFDLKHKGTVLSMGGKFMQFNA